MVDLKRGDQTRPPGQLFVSSTQEGTQPHTTQASDTQITPHRDQKPVSLIQQPAAPVSTCCCLYCMGVAALFCALPTLSSSGATASPARSQKLCVPRSTTSAVEVVLASEKSLVKPLCQVLGKLVSKQASGDGATISRLLLL